MLSRSAYRTLKRLHGVRRAEWEEFAWGLCYVVLPGLLIAGIILDACYR